MSDSTPKRRPRKDANRRKKPSADFPLPPHPSGVLQKMVRGKVHYFGRWAKLVGIDSGGWKDAREEHKKGAIDLQAGRTPRHAAGRPV